MSLIAFVLYMSANILLQAIIIFLMAIPIGMGLGIGLHIVKSFFGRQARKKTQTPEERAQEFINIETTAAASLT